MVPRQSDSPMQGDDRLAGSGRARDARRPAIAPIDQPALRRMKKDCPFLPRVVERPFQLLDIGQDPEAALRIGMGKRVDRRRRRPFRRRPGREIEERLSRLLWQMAGDIEQRMLVRGPHGAEPLERHAITKQCLVGDASEQQRLRHRGLGRRQRNGRGLDSLRQFDELRRAGHRMPLDLAPLGPGIGGVVMPDKAQHEARRGAVDD
jgi:hypothetical protein